MIFTYFRDKYLNYLIGFNNETNGMTWDMKRNGISVMLHQVMRT